MPKSRSEKEDVIKSLAENLKKAKMILLADFKGLKVKEVTELRRDLKKNQSECVVVKKTLMDLAFKEASIGVEAGEIPGNIIGVSFDFGEDLTPAKILTKFGKTHENMKILGGLWNKSFLAAAEVKALAALPSKEDLLSKVLSSLNAPLIGLVNVLAGNLRGLAQVLNARREILGKSSV